MVALGIVKEWAVFDVLWRLYYGVFPFPTTNKIRYIIFLYYIFFAGKYTLDLSLCLFYPGKSAKKFIR